MTVKVESPPQWAADSDTEPEPMHRSISHFIKQRHIYSMPICRLLCNFKMIHLLTHFPYLVLGRKLQVSQRCIVRVVFSPDVFISLRGTVAGITFRFIALFSENINMHCIRSGSKKKSAVKQRGKHLTSAGGVLKMVYYTETKTKTKQVDHKQLSFFLVSILCITLYDNNTNIIRNIICSFERHGELRWKGQASGKCESAGGGLKKGEPSPASYSCLI